MFLAPILRKVTIVDCIVLALVIGFFLFTQLFLQFGHSILGKLIFIALILYYTHRHFVYGFACCVMVIGFYFLYPKTVQELLESFSQMYTNRTELSSSFQDMLDHVPKPAFPFKQSPITARNTFEYAQVGKEHDDSCTVHDAYPKSIPEVHRESEDIFRKDHCNTKQVMVYKNLEVSKHDTAHHLSEIEFVNGICNPCDPTCHFSLRQKQEQTESEMIPEFTKSISSFIPEQIRKLGLFTSSGEPYTPMSSLYKE